MNAEHTVDRIVASFRRWLPAWAAAVTVTVAIPLAPALVHSQDEQLKICGGPDVAVRQAPRALPDLNAEGTTVKDSMDDVADVRRYIFQVPRLSTVEIYVGDQWYDLNMGVFSVGQRVDVACWSVSRAGSSERAQRRVISFVRPDEKFLEDLPPDVYILSVRPAYQRPLEGFDPARGFTLRVALIPNVCGLTPANTATDPNYPKLKQREKDEVNYYQAGVTFEPPVEELGPFALMTFSAHVSPPFTDLFDFEWMIDGQPVPGVKGPIVQRPYADLPKTPNGAHNIRLVAKGAREYRDPDPQFNHTPLNGGSLTVECTFRGPA